MQRLLFLLLSTAVSCTAASPEKSPPSSSTPDASVSEDAGALQDMSTDEIADVGVSLPDVAPSPDLSPVDMGAPDASAELPPIPWELEPVPAGETAPWPGTAVHGALVKVLEATDGDTLKIELADGIAHVRLLGLNAPECDKHASEFGLACDPADQDLSGHAEPYAVEAWERMSELVAGKEVRLACSMKNGACEQDLYDRTISYVVIDGLDVGEQLVGEGLGLTYTQFPPPNLYTYCVAEESALAAGLGLWENGRDAAIIGMNPDTRSWYSYHDSTCANSAP